MKIAVVTDTHDQVARVTRAVGMLAAEGAEALIHCGDLTTPAIVAACTAPGWPAAFVLGNNDRKTPAQTRALVASIATHGAECLGAGGILAWGGKRIAAAHGDQRDEVRRLLAARPDYLLVGHSHELRDERLGSTRCINAGALHRVATFTVALLDLASDELRILPIGR